MRNRANSLVLFLTVARSRSGTKRVMLTYPDLSRVEEISCTGMMRETEGSHHVVI